VSSYQLDSVSAAEARPAPARLGRYELIGLLATGGMAEIHLARLAGEAGFEKIVVVKRLLPELVASQTFVSMFLDEGKLVARLDHPNICEVHELGRDGAEYFLAMPYLDGVSVHALISRPRESDRIAELRVACAIVAQACAGLHHAHELRDADGAPANLVHRDVSPSNLFVTSTGMVKVLDFGVAKVRGATETEVGTIKGKQQYMAPEQVLGESLDRRTDIFALGIVLFELATHQRLFKRASDYLTARAILEEAIPRADEVDPAIPPRVADVIAKALARSAADRHATAAELANALVVAMNEYGGLAPQATIAQIVTSTDELSAQRTRQAKVVGDARTRATDVATDVGPTRPMRPYQTDTESVPPPPPIDTKAKWIALGGIGAVVVLCVSLLVVAMTGDENADGSAPARPDAAVASHTVDAIADVTMLEAAPHELRADAAVEAPPDVEMPPHNARVPKKPGTISIDSTPFATIYIDGKRVDVTPLLNRALPAGRHKIRAVLADGRAKELSVDVPAGKAAKPITLTW
jgi:serine/threonine protein kinase